jgi:hypothetical protein
MSETGDYCTCNRQVTRNFVYENDNICEICKKALLIDNIIDTKVRKRADQISDVHTYDDVSSDFYEEINPHPLEVTQNNLDPFFTDSKGTLLNLRRRDTQESPRRRSLPNVPDNISGIKTESETNQSNQQIPGLLTQGLEQGAIDNENENENEIEIEAEMDRAVRELRAMGSGLNMGKFAGGKGECPTKFLNKFDRFAAYQEWDNEKKTSLIPLVLDDKAIEFYEGLEEAKRGDYLQVRAAIIEHFEPNKLKLVKWSTLYNRKLEVGETVTEFHDVLKKIAIKIGGIEDEQVCQIFMNGLPTAAKSYLALQQPDSLAKALDLARLYESIDDLKSPNSDRDLFRKITEVAAMGPGQRSESNELRELRNQLSELRGEFKGLKEDRKEDKMGQTGKSDPRASRI